MPADFPSEEHDIAVSIPIARGALDGNLNIPGGAHGLVVFAHGSGSSRHSPRNRYVASVIREGRLATLLTDLLTPEEERVDLRTAELRFDIGLLAERVVAATDWLRRNAETRDLTIGYFGASTGAAAALVAATELPGTVGAVVSRGGRPDLAGPAVLGSVRAPTLLIVGGEDRTVLELNRGAYEKLGGEKRLVVVPGASHLFEEPGTLDAVADLAAGWFGRHLAQPPAAP